MMQKALSEGPGIKRQDTLKKGPDRCKLKTQTASNGSHSGSGSRGPGRSVLNKVGAKTKEVLITAGGPRAIWVVSWDQKGAVTVRSSVTNSYACMASKSWLRGQKQTIWLLRRACKMLVRSPGPCNKPFICRGEKIEATRKSPYRAQKSNIKKAGVGHAEETGYGQRSERNAENAVTTRVVRGTKESEKASQATGFVKGKKARNSGWRLREKGKEKTKTRSSLNRRQRPGTSPSPKGAPRWNKIRETERGPNST